MNFDIRKHTIYKVVSGSHAYGFATEESDIDYRGVAIPPKEYFLGFSNIFEQYEQQTPEDITIFDIRKFFKLAADCNPNVIELLWIPEKWVLKRTKYIDTILENRNLFLSKKVKYTYTGYAIAQLKRIQTHKQWLLNPVQKKPTRSNYGLPEVSIVGGGIRSILRAAEAEKIDLATIVSPQMLDIVHREKMFFEAQKEYEHYETWKKQRNQKRAVTENRYGYDLKHATHLVRLIRQCKEILTTGTILVERPDKEEMISIRNGAWSYEQLLEYVKKEENGIDELCEKCTILPHHPNIDKLNNLCVQVVEDFLNKEG